MKTVALVIRTRDAARQLEALRAAVGQTLRGARVLVIPLVPLGESRALAALRALGHAVDAPLAALREAHAVEVWS